MKLKDLKKKYPSIIYKICLLSNQIKDLTFYNMGYGSSVYEEKTNFERTVEKITSSTLDVELENLPINTTNNIIKLDVQGSEMNIIEGADKFCDRILGFEIEVEFMEFYENQPLFSEINSYMISKGYLLFDLNDSP